MRFNPAFFRAAAGFALCAAWSTPVFSLARESSSIAADEPTELSDELIHSDLPIYTSDLDEFWPRHIPMGQGIGCMTRVSFGDWKFTPSAESEFGYPWWVRFSNYGVFHCATNIYEAHERGELDEGEFSRGFFAQIGSVRSEGAELELWVLQQGFRTGSDYWLFAREPDDVAVGRFLVLQRQCPQGSLRELESFDSWRTDYCAINTHDDLLSLAKEMAQLPVLGTLELQKGPDTPVPDPSSSEN